MTELLEPLRGNVELLSYVLFVAVPFFGAVAVAVRNVWVARRDAARATHRDDHAPTGQPS